MAIENAEDIWFNISEACEKPKSDKDKARKHRKK
jgi:hypothetical protein